MLQTVREASRTSWKRVVVAVVSAAFLLPVPAFAITFLGSWTVFQSQSGGAPAATVSSGDTPAGGFLSVGMGAYSAPQAATSDVVAFRPFQVPNPSQLVTFQRQFSTELQNADLRVTVQFQRITGSKVVPNYYIGEVARGTARTVNVSRQDTRRFTGGLYMAIVTVHHGKTASGMWNNATPYRFTFTGT